MFTPKRQLVSSRHDSRNVLDRNEFRQMFICCNCSRHNGSHYYVSCRTRYFLLVGPLTFVPAARDGCSFAGQLHKICTTDESSLKPKSDSDVEFTGTGICKVTDVGQNVAQCKFSYGLLKDSRPILVMPETIRRAAVDVGGAATGQAVVWLKLSAHDDCGLESFTCTRSNGDGDLSLTVVCNEGCSTTDSFPIGETKVTCTVCDSAHQCTQGITAIIVEWS